MLKYSITGTEFRPSLNKWLVKFDLSKDSVVIGSVETPPLFEFQSDAILAGHRAMRIYEETGKFPNLCEKF